VALLSATINDPTVTPALLALTVGYELRSWRAEALARHLLEWVLDFALRRDERSSLPAGRVMEAARRAVKLVFGNGRDRGVPGEILLHAICRQFFGSDTVISKVWFKTAANDTYKGFDAVHCVHSGAELQLWLGGAKFYSDIDDALRSALSDLREHLAADYLRAEFALIADKIDQSHPHAAELRSLMHPNTSLDAVFDRIVVPVLVMYDSPATSGHDHDCDEYLADLKAEVRRAWQKFGSALDSRLPVTVRLFLVPMATKQVLLEALDKELAPWQ
jgi:Cap4 SAVED domain